MMWWYGNNGGGMNVWGYTLMTVSMVLFWGLVVFAVVAVVRHRSRGDRPDAVAPRTPEQILGERFARGDIDEQEYEGRLGALRRGSATLVEP